MILTRLQKQVLLDLLDHEDWAKVGPASQACLNKLSNMKLIDIKIEEDYLIQKLTFKGKEIARQIKVI